MSNDNTKTTADSGTLSGTVCDQYGNKLNKAVIEKVSYLPNGTLFSIISLMQMTAKGWIMGGNVESIWIKKDQNKVVFEMKIWTQNKYYSQRILLGIWRQAKRTKNIIETKKS